MKCYLLLFLVALAIAEENLSLEVQFSAFKTRFHRQYASDTEEKYRLRVFRENLQIIQEHNARQDSYRVGRDALHGPDAGGIPGALRFQQNVDGEPARLRSLRCCVE